MVTDEKIDVSAGISRQIIPVALITANSLTDELFYAFKPGYKGYVRDVQLVNAALTGAVGINVVVAGSTDILKSGLIEIDAVPEKFKVALSRYVFADVFVKKAAATAIVFTANHVVTQAKFGAILIQINASGTVSTKVNAATQTTALAYDTSLAAINALPAPDADNIAIGYIVVEALAGSNWVANTGDLVAASDLETVSFVTYAARTRSLSATLDAVAAKRVAGALGARSARRFQQTETIYGLITTDGTGALTRGQATIVITPGPLAGS